MTRHDTEVLIVGMGPVGSVLALILAQHGIDAIAIEAEGQAAMDLRASTFHAATVELLDTIGASATLLAEGLQAPIYQYRDRKADEIFEFDMAEIADKTRFPFRIQCEQHKFSRHMSARLQDEPTIDVRYRHRLLQLDMDDDGVDAFVETPLEIEQIRARFVVGADGGGSTVRKLLEIGFAGFTYDEKYLCLSTEHDLTPAFHNLCYVNYISDADEWLVLLRVPQLWRVLLPVPLASSDDDLKSDANKDEVFRRILGHNADVQTHHRTIYRIHQRVCETFVKDRVALLGDASHLNGPIGGFGMNSGIHDAFNLADKLVGILRRGEPMALLHLFDRQRRTVTNEVIQAETVENMRAMRSGWANQRVANRARMLHLSSDRDARRQFLLKQAMFTSLQRASEIT